jgi:spore coat polysaccharide biosynthesis protein SpsF
VTDGPVVAIVQARMGSTRLPGKTLARLGDESVLGWVLVRLARATTLDQVAVATSVDTADDPVEEAARAHGVGVVRGSLDDVLDRYRVAAEGTGAGTIVRITADCPFLDPAFVDAAVATLHAEHADLASTSLSGTVLPGLDCEAFGRVALEAAAAEAVDAIEREHVTPFIYRRPARFRSVGVPVPPWALKSDVRLTVDQAEDLELLRDVVERLGVDPTTLRTKDAVELVAGDAGLRAIVADVQHRNVARLRPVVVGDAERLLAWRNDRRTVEFSRSGRAVDPEEHRLWLANRLARATPWMWIAEARGEPVGHVRVDDTDGVPTVSIVVAPEHRREGHAPAILQSLMALVPDDVEVESLDAVVHRENEASLRAFTRAGFSPVADNGPWLVLRWRLGQR